MEHNEKACVKKSAFTQNSFEVSPTLVLYCMEPTDAYSMAVECRKGFIEGTTPRPKHHPRPMYAARKQKGSTALVLPPPS